MEKYELIDINKLDRADYFQYFMNMGTTVEITSKIDVSTAVKKCKNESINFQAYLLYKLYKAINLIDNFKYDIFNGKLIKWNKIVPTFSSFNQNTKLFFTLYANMKENYFDFNDQYKQTIAKYANSNTIVPQKELPPNMFNVSCIPWLHFDHFSSNTKFSDNKIVKMITIGKHVMTDEKLLCPITIQVSHAIADGFHISQFFEKLQTELL